MRTPCPSVAGIPLKDKSPLVSPTWISPDVRRALDALLATAIGTLAGILVDSGFGVRDSIVNAVLRLLGPLFDVFSGFPIAQLVVANFIDRIPIVLIVGLAVGMILRHVRYRLLLLWSTLIWLGCLLAKSLLLLLAARHGAGTAAVSPIRIGSFPEALGYLMQYGLLILVIRATDGLLARTAKRTDAPAKRT